MLGTGFSRWSDLDVGRRPLEPRGRRPVQEICDCELCESGYYRKCLEAARTPLDDQGPCSACWDCGASVPIAELWVGRRSGIALCDACAVRWEAAGRGRKKEGDF